MDKIKVTDELVERFLDFMDSYNEYVFGETDYIKKQLELCLNTQGYWSGNSIRVYYDSQNDIFYAESRF